MISLMRRERVAIIYLTDRNATSPAYLLLRVFGARRIIVHDHTSGERTAPRGVKWVVKWLWARLPWACADTVITVSDFVRDRVIRASLVPAHRVKRVWNGVRVPEIDPSAHEQVRRELKLPANTPLVLFCGRLTPEKGAHVLLRAFDTMSRRHSDLNAKLVVVGDGPQSTELQQLRATMPTRDQIFLLGYRSSISTYQCAATIVVVPSLWQEALGLAALEPLALGKAVIASRVGGIPEVVRHGETGLLVSPGDANELATAMCELLRHGSRREELGRAGRRRVLELFHLDTQIEAIASEILGA
jgi:glycosyltransferase involved in cell wall biosynthesis